MTEVTVVGAIIAVVKAVKELAPEHVHGLWTVVLAVALGAGAGYLGLEGLDVTRGIWLGLGAVGTVTIADRVGNNK